AVTLVATVMAWLWLPETVHRAAAGTGMPFRNLREMMGRPGLRRMLVIDFVYWFAFAIFQTTFALFAARRFGFDAPQTGYFFAAFGLLVAVVQGACIRPTVAALVSRAGRGDEQGRVQGAASAMESLGRTLGPVWGNASLQRLGEGTPYLSAAAFLALTLLMSATYNVVDPVDSRIADPVI